MPDSTLTLEACRAQAKARLKGICNVYKDCDGHPSRLCQGQHYGNPVRFGGIGSGASFHNNWLALRRVRLKMRVVSPNIEPDTTCRFLGHSLSMPVMAAPVTGVNSFGGEEVIAERDFCRATVQGCNAAGTLAWRGDTFVYSRDNTPGIDAIAEGGKGGVKIVKPRDQESIIRFHEKAADAGAVAVGVDVDGCRSHAMTRHGQPVFRKSADDLRELVAATSLPFIVKGVMCPEDALAAVDAGASAVVVSNHGGRVLDHTPGAADVLPGIADALRGRDVTVLADGGVRTGYDVLKMLALGAQAVLVGRDIVRAAVGGGGEGVRLQMECLRAGLTQAMIMTGCNSPADAGPGILAEPGPPFGG